MTIEPNDKNLSFIPLVEATTPRDGTTVLANRWWSVDPERGLLVWRRYSVQCNHSESIARKIGEKMYPWAETRFMPVVFLPGRHVYRGD
jgi:hypothetical protein